MRFWEERLSMVDREHAKLSIVEQCQILAINRSSFYYSPLPETELNLEIMKILDKQYFETPFYGMLKLTEMLKNEGYHVNVKRVRRLMKIMNLRTIYREPRTTVAKKGDYKYPYLLRGLKIERSNHPDCYREGDGHYLYSYAAWVYAPGSHH
jgi:putative transposase